MKIIKDGKTYYEFTFKIGDKIQIISCSYKGWKGYVETINIDCNGEYYGVILNDPNSNKLRPHSLKVKECFLEISE